MPPFGDQDDFDICPTGNEMVFSARDHSPSVAWETKRNIFSVAMTVVKDQANSCHVISMGNPTRISHSQGQESHPVYSPDGQSVAFLSMKRPGYESDKNRIMIYSKATRETKELAADWSLSPHSIAWSTDSSQLFLTAPSHGRNSIFSLPINEITNIPTPIIAEVNNINRSCSRVVTLSGSRLLFSTSSFTSPSEVCM